MLYSERVPKIFEVGVGRNELGKTVQEFRQLMEECEKRACGSSDIARIQPVSQKLYTWLIKPLEGELKNNGIQNIVFALDRVARYVPMGALFDGKKYLIENYTIYNVLSADLTDTTKIPLKADNTTVLAMGVSEAVRQFRPLPNVPQEIDAIVRNNSSNTGIYPGQKFLNSSFDFRNLRDNLANNKILHIATHGEFVAGQKNASYLLLGTGEKLTISNIRNLTGLNNINLAVLSACQTALSGHLQDGIEIASVGYYFLNSGTKAVIA
ncbi:MAG: CHAT domain-containing protein, partial [Calothrix sp. SM1_7_51]|nr:CHAT domain-containing protein [Calothrix sp. SM1_7_51]